jgi:hypothetical protein
MAVLKMDMSERDCGSEIGGGMSWEDVMAFVETRMKNFKSSIDSVLNCNRETS